MAKVIFEVLEVLNDKGNQAGQYRLCSRVEDDPQGLVQGLCGHLHKSKVEARLCSDAVKASEEKMKRTFNYSWIPIQSDDEEDLTLMESISRAKDREPGPKAPCPASPLTAAVALGRFIDLSQGEKLPAGMTIPEKNISDGYIDHVKVLSNIAAKLSKVRGIGIVVFGSYEDGPDAGLWTEYWVNKKFLLCEMIGGAEMLKDYTIKQICWKPDDEDTEHLGQREKP